MSKFIPRLFGRFLFLLSIVVISSACSEASPETEPVSTPAVVDAAMNACSDVSCLPDSLPESMKGYELYSWQNDDQWYFTLITGTNRNKTVEEVTGGGNEVSDDGWVKITMEGVKITMEGVETLLELLKRVPAGSYISWVNEFGIGTESVQEGVFQRPPQEMIDAIREICQEYSLECIGPDK